MAKIREKLEDFVVGELIDESLFRLARRSPNPFNRYLLVRVHKRGVDTLHVVGRLIHTLGLKSREVSFLGLKDARSVSTQYVCLARPPRRGDLSGLDVIGWLHRPLSKGDLVGNSFVVNVRLEETSADLYSDVGRFCSDVMERGIPNFFAYQRFGALRGVNHRVGRLMVRGMFNDAVVEYLTLSGRYEPEEVRKWRNELKSTLNFKEAYKTVPRRLLYEKLLLEELIRSGDPLRALRRLPLTLRRLFVNAYQAYLFNRALSLRVSRGITILRPQKGELCKSVVRGEVEVSPGSESRGDQVPLGQVIGYGYKKGGGVQFEIEREVMRDEEVTPKMFFVKQMPEVSSKGGVRELCLPVWSLTLLIDKKSQTIRVSMVLGAGGYATTLLRELIKPRDPYLQGF